MIEPRKLENAIVRLDPIEEAHREPVRALLTSDLDNWSMQTLSAVGEHFEPYWALMTSEARRVTFAVFDKQSGRLAGTSSFLGIDPKHRQAEIGYTFFHPDFRGTQANPATKLLMLREAFAAGAVRVQFTVSAVNARSREAVLKLGARQDGILRNHRITWQGELRDTVVFSILPDAWPEIERALQERLER